MAKKILVINGSPKAIGNTGILVAHFIQGAQEAGHVTTRLDVGSLNIKPCMGCNACQKGLGSPCVQTDDMAMVYQTLKEADVVVIASPLYWMQFSAQLKALMDRLYALAPDPEEISHKEGALIICAASPKDVISKHIVPYYNLCFMESLAWTDRGMVLAGGAVNIGDVMNTGYPGEAYALGKSI